MIRRPDLAAVADEIETASVHLARWHDRGVGYVAAGHLAVASIDATLQLLYATRAALTRDLRRDEDERSARVDVLLAAGAEQAGGAA